MSEPHAEQFESADVQAHAAKLGMWIFLASEMLLFSGLFALFFAGRAHDPASFRDAVHHNTKVLGSVNTAVLLTSSTVVALGVKYVRVGRGRAAMSAMMITMALGVVFLVIKIVEYAHHLNEGIDPGGSGRYFSGAHGGEVPFWTLYYAMTGLHAIHVMVGIIVLGVTANGIRRREINTERSHPAEIGALYWHLIDLIWIFLWPLLYLA